MFFYIGEGGINVMMRMIWGYIAWIDRTNQKKHTPFNLKGKNTIQEENYRSLKIRCEDERKDRNSSFFKLMVSIDKENEWNNKN